MAVQFPNLKIKQVLISFIDLVIQQHKDSIAAGFESESWLYRVFSGVVEQEFDFYEQAINILVNRDKNSPKKLEIRLNFDPTITSTPTIFINSPSELQDGTNTVGMNGDTFQFNQNDDGTLNEDIARVFKGEYELMITSENQLESELLYRFLFALFIGFHQTLSENFEGGVFMFSGKQLMANSNLIPTLLYYKVVTVTVFNKIQVPQFPTTSYGNDVTYEGTPIEENI